MSPLKYLYVAVRNTPFSDDSVGGTLGIIFGGLIATTATFFCWLAKWKLTSLHYAETTLVSLFLVGLFSSYFLGIFITKAPENEWVDEYKYIPKSKRWLPDMLCVIFHVGWIPLLILCFLLPRS